MENLTFGNDFDKRCKLRIGVMVCLIVLGCITAVLGQILPIATSNPEFSSGFYAGAGSGLVFVAFVGLAKNLRYLRDPEIRKAQMIRENDERNKLIGLKTWAWSGYAMFLLLYVALIVAGFFSILVMKVLIGVLLAYVICVLVSGLVLKNIM